MRAILVIILSAIFISGAFRASADPTAQEEPRTDSSQAQPSTEQEKTSAEAKTDQEIQKRVKELIELINQEPKLLVVNPKAQVVSEPDRKRYTPDGRYNHDFKVIPDDSSPEIANALQIEQNREKWTQELVKIGIPAVPELILAVLDSTKKYRHFYVQALAQIKEIKSVPAILKYFSEAVEEEKLAKSLEQLGMTTDALKLKQESDLKKKEAISALKLISGKDFGEDYQKWEQWWKETEKTIGPVELPKPYEIKGKGISSPKI